MRKGIAIVAVATAVCFLLSGCSSSSARKAEYQRAATLPPLEVPPDLTAPDLQGDMDLPQSYSAHVAQGGDKTAVQVLPQQANVQVLRDRDMRWLQVNAEPEQIWARLREFWQKQGLEIKVDEPRLGLMETQWAENKADVPGDWVTNMVSKLFKGAYSAPTRDKYRMRVERGAASGTTEIFVAHYGLEEVQRGQNAETYDTIWQNRPADPELVAEMLNRMMVYFGVPQAQAETQLAAAAVAAEPRARLDGAALQINESFPRAWRRVGIALDRLGLVVEDRDRSAGLYYIRPVDQVADAGKKGFFSSLFSGKEEDKPAEPPARILLQGSGETTRVTVQDKSGTLATSAQAMTILQQLETELR